MVDINLNIPQIYKIKLELFECRKLLLQEGIVDQPQPYVVVKVGDQTVKTETKKGDSPSLDQKFDFNLFIFPEELKNQKISFQVYHKTAFYKSDSFIGSHSLDVWTVYSKGTHMINKQWAILENEISGSINSGFIKFSVIVLGESDKMPGIQILIN